MVFEKFKCRLGSLIRSTADADLAKTHSSVSATCSKVSKRRRCQSVTAEKDRLSQQSDVERDSTTDAVGEGDWGSLHCLSDEESDTIANDCLLSSYGLDFQLFPIIDYPSRLLFPLPDDFGENRGESFVQDGLLGRILGSDSRTTYLTKRPDGRRCISIQFAGSVASAQVTRWPQTARSCRNSRRTKVGRKIPKSLLLRQCAAHCRKRNATLLGNSRILDEELLEERNDQRRCHQRPSVAAAAAATDGDDQPSGDKNVVLRYNWSCKLSDKVDRAGDGMLLSQARMYNPFFNAMMNSPSVGGQQQSIFYQTNNLRSMNPAQLGSKYVCIPRVPPAADAAPYPLTVGQQQAPSVLPSSARYPTSMYNYQSGNVGTNVSYPAEGLSSVSYPQINYNDFHQILPSSGYHDDTKLIPPRGMASSSGPADDSYLDDHDGCHRGDTIIIRKKRKSKKKSRRSDRRFTADYPSFPDVITRFPPVPTTTLVNQPRVIEEIIPPEKVVYEQVHVGYQSQKTVIQPPLQKVCIPTKKFMMIDIGENNSPASGSCVIMTAEQILEMILSDTSNDLPTLSIAGPFGNAGFSPEFQLSPDGDSSSPGVQKFQLIGSQGETPPAVSLSMRGSGGPAEFLFDDTRGNGSPSFTISTKQETTPTAVLSNADRLK